GGGVRLANWNGGYGDVHLVPDLATLRAVPWLDRTAMVLCDLDTMGHDPVEVAPRTILRRQIDRLAQLGFTAQAASELEYYLFRTSYRDAAAQGYRDLESVGWYIEDYHLLQGTRTEDLNGPFRRHLRDFGVPVESTKGEFGHGQHELNIRYCDILEMADRHVLLKQCVKEVSDQLGASATFMAKPRDDEAGSSSHLHLSLWAGDRNAFAGERSIGGLQVSDTFEGFLAGWMQHATDLMPCMAPTVNSYKRYQAQSWAPTGLAWSPDNRTAGFRVVGSGPSLRIECRLPGADVNPYLAYAAALAAGIDGLEQHLTAPEPFQGDVYADPDQQKVPHSLEAAVERFASSSLTRSSFGDAVVDHYTHFWRTEANAYHRAVTDWERRRYFERI
ncbi:MAG: glutamine synthetase family protein, partial [Actinomycetota bacterium]|nr:glutamine synthetase family protein [Actinomycetota bacterium]